MPSLPIRPDLDQYRTQAKELLASCQAGDAEALARVADCRQRPDHPILSDAQLALAREHGFDSWPRFKHAIELSPQLRDALDPGDPERVRAILAEAPQLADCIPWPQHRPDSRAIEIISAACVWHRPLKHEIAQALIAAGASCDITLAARAGSVERVRTMLDDQPDLIDFRDARGRTALYRAGCVYGQFKEGEAVVDLLLERGAQPDIYVAATFAMAAKVGQLLAHDADLAHARDPDGMTALHWALRPRRTSDAEQPVEVTRLLLEAGADVHAPDPAEDDMQPLHHYGEWGAAVPQQADLLLAHGADINAQCRLGWTPLDYAIDRSRTGIADYLIARGGKESGRR